MADTPPDLRANDGWMRWLTFEGVLSALNSIGTLYIFILMIVITLDVIGRTVFNAPVPGVLELVRLSIVGIIFIQIGHTLRAGRITRSDNMITRLQARSRALGFGLQAVYALAGTFVFAVLLYASMPHLAHAWSSGEYAGIEGYITFPVWPVKLVILIGCVCAGIQFLLFAWRDGLIALGLRAPEARAQSLDAGVYGSDDQPSDTRGANS